MLSSSFARSRFPPTPNRAPFESDSVSGPGPFPGPRDGTCQRRALAQSAAGDFAPMHKLPIYKAGGVLLEHPPALHGLIRTRITAKFYGPGAWVSTESSSAAPPQNPADNHLSS